MGRVLRWSLLGAFALAVGHFAWATWATWATFGSTTAPEYLVGGEVTALVGPDPSSKHLYLRRTLHLPRRPQHAWIQVLARDRVRLYVNGKLVARQIRDGFTAALLVDLTPHLQSGPNVLAIAAEQATVGQPPAVAVEGACFHEAVEQSIVVDEQWRCSSVFDRGASWWFAPEFDEHNWAPARFSRCELRGEVTLPPRAVTTPGSGQWITATRGEPTVFRRAFEVDGRSASAWIRLTATAPYRLAINGTVVDVREEELATNAPVREVQRTYDLTGLLHGGINDLTVALTPTAGQTPHLLLDGEVETTKGQRLALSSGGSWLIRPGLAPDGSWEPAAVVPGYAIAPPWGPDRAIGEIRLPAAWWVARTAELVGWILLTGFLTAVACQAMVWFLSRRGAGAVAPGVYLALVPAALGLGGAALAVFDPRVASQEVYQIWWLLAAVGSVPFQWLLLSAFARRGISAPGGSVMTWRPPAVGWEWALVGVLMAAGFGLRLRDLPSEPLHPDEVDTYRITQGFLERGFPSAEVTPDMPPKYTNTSELVYPGTALTALVFDDDRYVVRFPAVCWATLTIGLIYLVGRQMFGWIAGATAALLYTVAPVCIQLADFGRYFSQLQFLTLLTAYLFWRTIAGSGPINSRALWLTTISFIAMFLSWEGSALIAPGLVVAALVQRRGRLDTLVCRPAVWAAMGVVALVAVLQQSHRILQQTQLLSFGTGLSDLSLMPMWRYPIFDFWYYFRQASWNQDGLLPLVGLVAGGAVAVRHAYRRPARVLLLTFVTTAAVMTLILPHTAWRYGYHLLPLTMLLASAGLVAGCRALIGWAQRPIIPAGVRYHAIGVSALAATAFILAGSGLTLQLAELESFRVLEGGAKELRFPDLAGPVAYLRNDLRPGDVVMASHPHVVKHYLGGQAHDLYWPQSRLHLQAVLDDQRALPLDRRYGAVMVPDVEGLADLFARHERIWYVVVPGSHDRKNDDRVSAYLRQHMQVVYQDFQTIVLFRDRHHRPAEQRQADEERLQEAGTDFLR